MRSSDLVVLLLALIAITAAATTTTSPVNITQIISEIPSCALGCILKGFSPTCSLSDPACLCTNQTLQATRFACVERSCTVPDLKQLGVVNDALCAGFPVESRGSETVIAGAVLISLSLFFIFLRCYSRYSIMKSLWWDDWIILVAGATLIAILVSDVSNVKLGFGKHLWNVEVENSVPLFKILFVAEFLYILALVLTKVSILLFYLRIFQRPMFQTIVIFIMGFVISCGIAFIFAVIFQCNPVSGAWDKSLPAKCINGVALVFSNAGVSIAQDLIILVLPVSELASLQMSWKKKLSVMGMFGIGSVACIASMVRLKVIATSGASIDPTWDNVPAHLWSLIEVCFAMICACLPAVRALLGYWFPSIFEIVSKVTSRNQLSNSVQLESQSDWAKRKTREDFGDGDEEMIIQSTLKTKEVKITRFSQPLEDPQPTPPKTPVSDYGFNLKGSRLSVGPSTRRRDSDEVEMLDDWVLNTVPR